MDPKIQFQKILSGEDGDGPVDRKTIIALNKEEMWGTKVKHVLVSCKGGIEKRFLTTKHHVKECVDFSRFCREAYLFNHGNGSVPELVELLVNNKCQRFYLITEKYPFDLQQFMDSGRLKNLSFTERENMALKILRKLAFIHHLGFVHGDLKEENILISNDLEPVFIDFENAFRGESKGLKYCLLYDPPDHPYNSKSDSWVIALIVFHVLRGESLLFDQESHEDIVKFVSNHVKDFTERWQAFFVNMLQQKNEKRWTVEDSVKFLDK